MSSNLTKMDVMFQEILKSSLIKDKYGLTERDLSLSLEDGLKSGGKKVIRAVAEIVYQARTSESQGSKELESSANSILAVLNKYKR